MKLYHGSSCRDIEKFDLNKGRKNTDYGKGVYFTTNFEQAVEWSCKHSKTGAVYECDVDLAAFRGFNFSADNEDVYYYIYLCRLNYEEVVPDAIDGAEKADYVQGVMLGGNIKNFEEIAERFNKGDISLEEFKSSIAFFDDKDQTCIKTEKAIGDINANITKVYLTFKKDKNGKVFVEK